ncbi:zinc/iron-chelating domain-containing protein [Methanobacterium sp. MZ-A1]|uniref:Zinc/iron-chelating domain-containing protein n=1 Tax=Methanobacterium subterraneum TaxID=59277 RepID=A0A2H4VEH0_9EURY|nr:MULTISPECIES: YkgJ family cysteine cluster protein [Methanobacterium]AUB56493.1 zinc/iron-chelating domain-containing protein [Methanobacterium subterraneum]AUB58638.1 zinc/iron-chelating domain-containing protein [Methanobacterium sp. MZ-A1]
MLRDLLINKELFETLREKFLESDDGGMNTNEEIELLEKAVFNRLKKKRSVKRYKKLGVSKGDLKEIIQLADIISLDAIGGPSNYELAKEHQEWCTICGRCCRESESIFIHKDELNLLLTFNPDLEKGIIRNKLYPEHFELKDIRPCKFIDDETNKCRIYNSRPQVCRSYPLVLIESNGKAKNIINLRSKCNYSVNLILEKSMILFDEAIRRLRD